MKLAWLAVLTACACAQAPGVSFVNEGTIQAPIAEVWKVFSTSEGYRAVGVALAEVDLRVGGVIRSRYKANGALGDDETIENAILAYEPPNMIALRIQKPPKTFPFKEAWRQPWTVMTLRDLGAGRTHMRVTSLGYGTDPDSVAMRKFFEHGNQETIETLRKHFAGSAK